MSDVPIIRVAEAKDIDALVALDGHVERDVYLKKVDVGEVVVMEMESAVMGFLRWNLFWDELPFMNILMIIESQRGKGYGRALVDEWERQMRDLGHAFVLTSTQEDEASQHFYRKLGYQDIGLFALPGEARELMLYKKLTA
jgi:N-acetylglutamate synthase-like GNAT family acetyltransferase